MTTPSNKPRGMPSAGSHHSSRLVARQDVLIGVKFRRRGESWFAARVTDISSEGFRLSSFARLDAGMAVWIMLPGFEGRGARVIWVGDHEVGCVFDTPLHPAILDYIVRMSDPAARL
jgi:hypothetical protein